MDTSTLPTKNNLMRLKDKIKLSKQGRELLEKKKFILTVEKEKYKEKRNTAQKELDALLLEEGYKYLIDAIIDIGLDELMDISEEIKKEDSINIKYKTVMGVEIPSVISEPREKDLNYGLYNTTEKVDKTIIIFEKIKQKIIELAELETIIYRIDKNIQKVQARSNALEDIIIPNDEKIAHEISNILEERDREELSRMKIIKKGI